MRYKESTQNIDTFIVSLGLDDSKYKKEVIGYFPAYLYTNPHLELHYDEVVDPGKRFKLLSLERKIENMVHTIMVAFDETDGKVINIKIKLSPRSFDERGNKVYNSSKTAGQLSYHYKLDFGKINFISRNIKRNTGITDQYISRLILKGVDWNDRPLLNANTVNARL